MLLLDGTASPYLPTREILDAIANGSEQDQSSLTLAHQLRARLAMVHGVSADRIALFPFAADRYERVASVRPDATRVVYPPDALPVTAFHDPELAVELERGHRFRIEAAQIASTPPGSIAFVVTPNDPTGNAISVTSAAQLGRRAGLLVLDERSAEMQRRSMIPLVEEFDSIVLLRSFADWAGLGEHAPAYAITTKGIAAAIDCSTELGAPGLNAALAAVSNASMLDAVAQKVRIERVRLFRMLRKLNFLSPYPSDAGYVLAEVTRGERDAIAAGLSQRGIAVYAPLQERLRGALRFSAISPVATATLRAALIEISRTIVD